MCTVGGGRADRGPGFLLTLRAPVCAFLVFVSAEASRRHREASPADKGDWEKFSRAGQEGL